MVLVEQEKSRQKKLAVANGTAPTATSTTATATTAGGRSLRSSAPAGEGAENGTSGNAYSRDYQYGRSGGAANGVSGAGANAGSSSSGGARKRTTASAPSLDFLLPENSMRYDFILHLLCCVAFWFLRGFYLVTAAQVSQMNLSLPMLSIIDTVVCFVCVCIELTSWR